MSTWREIDAAFTRSSSGGLLMALDYQAVVSSIDNILRTIPGERVMLPEFGSGVTGLIFENMGPLLADNYADMIKEAIETWDSRVRVAGVSMTEKPDNNFLAVRISFTIIGDVRQYEYNGVLG